MPSDWSEEKAKSAMIKASWKDKFFSYSWVFERFMFSFIFEKTSSSLPMLFVHIEKSSSENLRNSRLQMFFKIGVRKKHLCSSFFLIKLGPWKPVFLFKKKNIPTQVFSCEYCELSCGTRSVHYSDDKILWTSLGTILMCFIFLVLLLCYPSYWESIVIS